MSKVNEKTISAFMNRERACVGNTMTDGNALFLHGNKIAEFREDGSLWITKAGWSSNVTKERLNAIPGVSIYQKNFHWYLTSSAGGHHNQQWDGEWTCVRPGVQS